MNDQVKDTPIPSITEVASVLQNQLDVSHSGQVWSESKIEKLIKKSLSQDVLKIEISKEGARDLSLIIKFLAEEPSLLVGIKIPMTDIGRERVFTFPKLTTDVGAIYSVDEEKRQQKQDSLIEEVMRISASKRTVLTIAKQVIRIGQIAAGLGIIATIVIGMLNTDVALQYPLLPLILLIGFSFAFFGAAFALKGEK